MSWPAWARTLPLAFRASVMVRSCWACSTTSVPAAVSVMGATFVTPVAAPLAARAHVASRSRCRRRRLRCRRVEQPAAVLAGLAAGGVDGDAVDVEHMARGFDQAAVAAPTRVPTGCHRRGCRRPTTARPCRRCRRRWRRRGCWRRRRRGSTARAARRRHPGSRRPPAPCRRPACRWRRRWPGLRWRPAGPAPGSRRPCRRPPRWCLLPAPSVAGAAGLEDDPAVRADHGAVRIHHAALVHQGAVDADAAALGDDLAQVEAWSPGPTPPPAGSGRSNRPAARCGRPPAPLRRSAP
jgi:hypothetical protein